MDEPTYTFKQPSERLITLMDFKPNSNISFHRDGKQVGVLDFNGPEMVFTGDADESAKVFFDFIAKSFKARLEQERTDERNSWPAEMEAMERQVNILTDALAEQPAQQEPVAWGVFSGTNLHDMFFTEEEAQELARLKGDGSKVHPFYTSPPAQRTWVGLMRGVRVEGDTVVITVKGGNDAARELCGALLEEKNT